MNTTRWILCGIASLALASCGDEAETTTLDTGIPGDRTLNDLSESEAQDLCQAAESAAADFSAEAQEGLCALTGALAGAFGAIGGGDPVPLCEQTRQECNNQPPQPIEGTCDVSTVPETCDVTVAELETCYDESLAAIRAVFDEVANASCSELLDENAAPISGEIETPASCANIESRCPGLNAGVPEIGDD